MLTQLPDEGTSGPSERVAQLRVTPDELTRAHGIKWSLGQDDLDSFRHALVRANDDAGAFRLLAYEHDPDASVLVLGPISPSLDPDLAELIAALDVPQRSVRNMMRAASADPMEVMTPAESAVSTELVFGLVGAVGTDLGLVTSEIQIALRAFGYRAEEVRLSALLGALNWKDELPNAPLDVHIAAHMDAGNKLRRRWGRGDALALLALTTIADIRAARNEDGDPSKPLSRFAFIIRSLKHPEEVELLRSVYGSRFYLVSAYAPRDMRTEVLRRQAARDYGSEDPADWSHQPEALIERDESEDEPAHPLDGERPKGQNVRDTFHRADFFLDARLSDRLKPATNRMVEIVFGHPFRTPTRDEYALFQAEGAARRSAELGRQVGAAITAKDGSIIALGTNEVPRAGGGTYWEGGDLACDGREFRNGVDTNDRMKHEIAREVVHELSSGGWLAAEADEGNAAEILRAIERTRLGSLIEFGRAVHAEMDALLDAARRGVAVQGGTLYTTTFPCHNCARHIIAAGIERVVYVAPYAKSLARDLHGDAIDVARHEPRENVVHFEPFVGVAPRRYLDLFEASRRKEDDGRVVDFVPSEATARMSDLEPDDLRPREERYTQREELALDLLGEIMEASDLGLAEGEEDAT